MSERVLVEELRDAAPQLAALRDIFAAHSQAVEEWPTGYSDVRRLSQELVGEGKWKQAALVLIAAFEDLRRFFVDEDEDSDFGWRRGEAKQWERWANARALRSVLIDRGEDAQWSTEVLEAVGDLFRGGEPSSAHWFEPTDLMAFSSDDATIFEERSGASGGDAWTPPEQAVASQLLGRPVVDPDTIRQAVLSAASTEAIDDAEECLDQLYMFRRVSERLSQEEEWEPAVMTALEGLLYAAEQLDRFRAGHSEDAEAVASEQTRALESVLEEGVGQEGPELRRRVLESAERDLEVLEDIRHIVGRGDARQVARDVSHLTRRFEASEDDDERRKLARQLIFQFGDTLSDEQYIGICAEYGWVSHQVERLLSAGRFEDANAAAMEAFGRDSDVGRHWVTETAQCFLAHGHAERAARLVEPFASDNLELAELRARALRESGRSDALDAHFRWFKMRPTLETYRAIEAGWPAGWSQIKERLEDYLRSAKLQSTLVDIAVEEGDIDALNELIPSLNGMFLEHARGRIGDLKPSLSREAVARLERR